MFPMPAAMDVVNQLLGINMEPRDPNVLQVSLRVRGQITRIEEIGLAMVERGGQISIIPRK